MYLCDFSPKVGYDFINLLMIKSKMLHQIDVAPYNVINPFDSHSVTTVTIRYNTTVSMNVTHAIIIII